MQRRHLGRVSDLYGDQIPLVVIVCGDTCAVEILISIFINMRIVERFKIPNEDHARRAGSFTRKINSDLSYTFPHAVL